ncbi:GNAT family acetyltransferase [Thermobacillus xylanilyticus]|jgi:ElaA protein|uniref:GNAT family acetyltransferase n=1 Tax=Thermobacillus xylanilyticus TaxID=76633 RepID=A0ABM8V720_THEXY|nr:GNAT family N-acetyltransferase [Thermobacillus xylanilyticus]CAG5091263.1 GNAT family acetyltransferase [Thermobacillus xylanilyticus]
MELKAKFFDELTSREIYEILRARYLIFKVEQKIDYCDFDDIDFRSLHIFLESDRSVKAYLRAFFKDSDKQTVQVGRVLTMEHGAGHGRRLIEEGIRLIQEKLNPDIICLESQKHAVGFYEKFGFAVVSEEFIEAGIPHVEMVLKVR